MKFKLAQVSAEVEDVQVVLAVVTDNIPEFYEYKTYWSIISKTQPIDSPMIIPELPRTREYLNSIGVFENANIEKEGLETDTLEEAKEKLEPKLSEEKLQNLLEKDLKESMERAQEYSITNF